LISASRKREVDKVADLAGIVPHPAAQPTALAIKTAAHIGRNIAVRKTFTKVSGHWRRTHYGHVWVEPHKRRIR